MRDVLPSLTAADPGALINEFPCTAHVVGRCSDQRRAGLSADQGCGSSCGPPVSTAW